ncbi:hypothetical protein HYG86_09655 [Alkalicella caledoniensis]|uniref:Uncharacterized protein n=1 Tax=Alkalicella caledoniensis TaxID=2731377 RepID=A0A7G9W8K1_ALKCA|nr:hypothetical protein [Alkalicella caledoniensis]QNO15013.1 hypothetical protein HYG86_09655 [Alkalicella caledoniensis]
MKKKITPPTEMVAPEFDMTINEQEILNATGVDEKETNWRNVKNHLDKPEIFGDIIQGEWSNNWAPVDMIDNPPK